MKRFLSMLLVVCMIAIILPMNNTARAETITKGSDPSKYYIMKLGDTYQTVMGGLELLKSGWVIVDPTGYSSDEEAWSKIREIKGNSNPTSTPVPTKKFTSTPATKLELSQQTKEDIKMVYSAPTKQYQIINKKTGEVQDARTGVVINMLNSGDWELCVEGRDYGVEPQREITIPVKKEEFKNAFDSVPTPIYTPVPVYTPTPTPTPKPTPVPIVNYGRNLAPVFFYPQENSTFEAYVGREFSFQLQASDPEGKRVLYALDGRPSEMTINSESGLVRWTPSSFYSNKYWDVRCLATDSRLGDSSANIAYMNFKIYVSTQTGNSVYVPTSTPVPTATLNPIEVLEEITKQLENIQQQIYEEGITTNDGQVLLEPGKYQPLPEFTSDPISTPTQRQTNTPTPTPSSKPTTTPTNSPSPKPVVTPTSESDSEIEEFEDIEDAEVNIVVIPQKISLNIPLNFTFNQDLHYGSRGTDVLYLQRLLNASGTTVANYGWGSLGRETEYFGVLTYNAVIRFQRKYGLFVNGVIDNTTRAKLNAILAESLAPMKPILLYPFDLFLLEENFVDFGGMGTPDSIVSLYLVTNGDDRLLGSVTVNSVGYWRIQGVNVPTGELVFKLVAKKNEYVNEALVFEEYRGNFAERKLQSLNKWVGESEIERLFFGIFQRELMDAKKYFGVDLTDKEKSDLFSLVSSEEMTDLVLSFSPGGIGVISKGSQSAVKILAQKSSKLIKPISGFAKTAVKNTKLILPFLKLVKKLTELSDLKAFERVLKNPDDVANLTNLFAKHGDDVIKSVDEMAGGFKRVKFDVDLGSKEFLRRISHSWGRHYKDWIKLGYRTEDEVAKAVKEIVEKGLKGDSSVRVGIQRYLGKDQYFFVKETGTKLGDIFIPFTKIGEPRTGFIRKNVWIGRDTKIVEWIFELFD